MDEMSIGLVILLMVLAPIVAGSVCLILRKLSAIGKVVGITAAMLIVSVLLLSSQILSGGPIARQASDLTSFSTIITVLDIVLILSFIYLAWRVRSVLAGIFAVIQMVVMAAIELNGVGEHGLAIYVDQLSLMMAFITSVIGSIICLYAVRYMAHYKDHGRFFAVMLLFLGAMNGAVFSNSLLWLFFFWEITTLCSYLLIGHTGTEQARRSAITAAKYTLGGGVALILGIMLTIHYFGTIFIDQIPIGTTIGGLALLPLALMAIAAFTKSAQIPFQKWLLGAMVAPTPVSALLHSATMVNLGLYLLLRLSPSLHGTGPLMGMIGLVGVLSFLITAVLAITQSNAKRVLAYSTIGNLGLIVACVGFDSSLSLTAAMLLLLFHAISKALLFMSVGVVRERSGSEDIDDMEGLRDTMPLVAASIMLGVFMMVLPPFGMFASKWLLSESVTSLPFMAIFLVLGFGATLVYYAKWLGRVFTGGTGRGSFHRDETPRTYVLALAATALIGIFATVAIGPILDGLINPYVTKVFDPAMQMGSWSLVTSLGLFPIFALIALAAVMALVTFLPRKTPPEANVYTCGENCEVETGTFYYWSETRITKVIGLANIGMSVLLFILVLTPVLQEVTA